jgi:hypothetical protein
MGVARTDAAVKRLKRMSCILRDLIVVFVKEEVKTLTLLYLTLKEKRTWEDDLNMLVWKSRI